jgi:WD40 repeat protein
MTDSLLLGQTMGYYTSSTSTVNVSRSSFMVQKVRTLSSQVMVTCLTSSNIRIDEMVQTIAACKSPTQYILATTSMEGDGTVKIWTKERKSSSSSWDVIRLLLLLLVAFVLLHAVLKVRKKSRTVKLSDCSQTFTEYWIFSQKQLPFFWKKLSYMRSQLPLYPMYIRNGIRRVIRSFFNDLRGTYLQMWSWVEKDERDKTLSRVALMKRYRQYIL